MNSRAESPKNQIKTDRTTLHILHPTVWKAVVAAVSLPASRPRWRGLLALRPSFQANAKAPVAAVFIACFAAGCAAAATIRGTVLDPSGRPVPQARVSLLRSLAALEEHRADSRGQYEFTGLSAGNYRLVANAPGFSSSPADVQIAEIGTESIDLHMQLSAVTQQVVVSAALGGALAPQLGSSVSVINHQEIIDRGAQSVLEILRGVPGVEVDQTGRRGGVAGVFIRGGNSNYNLVMIDGIQVNQFGGDFDFAPLTVDGVERVEVIRDPESALYGSNAVTGVINVVSRRGERPANFSLREELGSFNTWRIAAGAGGQAHGLGWTVDVNRLYSRGVVPNDQYRDQNGIVSLDYARSARRHASFHFFGNANDAGAPGPFGSDPLHVFPGIDRVARDKQNLFAYEGSYTEQIIPRFRQVVRGSISTNDVFFHTAFGDSFSHNLRGVLNTRSEVTISNNDYFVAGVEYNRDQTKNTFIADGGNTPFLLPRTSYAYFAENRWSPANRWFLTTGIRADDIRTHALPADAFGLRPLLPAGSVVKVDPRVSAAYLARDGSASSGVWGTTRLHGSFGTGIRAPSGFELAFTNNPHLKPEESISFDAGVEQRFLADRVVIDATYFYNRFKDQIVVLGGSLSHLSSFASDNLANSRAQGVETSLRIRPTRSVEVAAEYTRLNTAILALDGSRLAPTPFQVGQPLVRRPRNSAGWNATWKRGRLMLNLNGYARGPVLDVEPNLGLSGGLFRNKGYVLANSGFAYRAMEGFEIYGRLNNFLNQKYEESFGFPALHLNFLAGIRYNFPGE